MGTYVLKGARNPKIKFISNDRALDVLVIRPMFGNPSLVRYDRPNFPKPLGPVASNTAKVSIVWFVVLDRCYRKFFAKFRLSYHTNERFPNTGFLI